jgi:hypothetical protein
LAQTAIEYPPMQAPASFNLEAVKREVEEKIKGHEGQWSARSFNKRALSQERPQLTGLDRSLSGSASEIPILHSRPCEQDLAWLDPSRGKAVRRGVSLTRELAGVASELALEGSDP